MSEITDILSANNIPISEAIQLEKAFEKKFVARLDFPPVEWEKSTMMPMQFEQIKASERIESLRVQMDSRFREGQIQIETLNEKMDARFQAVHSQMDTLNEKMDARFQAVHSQIDTLNEKMDTRFQAVYSQIDSLNEKMDAKFAGQDSKFAAIDDRFRILMWMNAILVTMAFTMFSKLLFS